MKTETKAPKLHKFKTRGCRLEELQAALVLVIEFHNSALADINEMIRKSQIRSRRKSIENTPYGL